MFEIHKDSKNFVYLSAYIFVRGFFLSATWKDIAKKSKWAIFFQAYFLIHLIQNCPKMETESSDDHLKLFIISESEVPFKVALFVTWE